jgi:hypothetical protein
MKGKQLYSVLCGEYTEVLELLMAVPKESAAKAETAKTTMTAPPSVEKFREQRRRKQKPTDDANKRAKEPTTSTTGVNDPQMQPKPDHADDADNTTEYQQHQASARQVGRLSSKPDTTAKATEGHTERQL